MRLCDIFDDYKNGDLYEFETEFETLYLSNEKGYFEGIDDLTRVVRKSFYEEIIKLTKNKSFNQGYFFLPSHVCDKIDEIFFDFSENEKYDEWPIEEINSLKAAQINELICKFENHSITKSDKCSTSFFLVRDGINNWDLEEILLGLKKKVTNNTEPVAVLRGNINSGIGLLRKSNSFTAPHPKFKHVSFWKKKTGSTLADFTTISNQFNMLEKDYETNE